jgi:hypothetical protein
MAVNSAWVDPRSALAHRVPRTVELVYSDHGSTVTVLGTYIWGCLIEALVHIIVGRAVAVTKHFAGYRAYFVNFGCAKVAIAFASNLEGNQLVPVQTESGESMKMEQSSAAEYSAFVVSLDSVDAAEWNKRYYENVVELVFPISGVVDHDFVAVGYMTVDIAVAADVAA